MRWVSLLQYPNSSLLNGVIHRVWRKIRPIRPLDHAQHHSRLSEYRWVSKRLEDGPINLRIAEKAKHIYLSRCVIDEIYVQSRVGQCDNRSQSPRYGVADLRCYFNGSICLGVCN